MLFVSFLGLKAPLSLSFGSQRAFQESIAFCARLIVLRELMKMEIKSCEEKAEAGRSSPAVNNSFLIGRQKRENNLSLEALSGSHDASIL